jgi:hypothetical protein
MHTLTKIAMAAGIAVSSFAATAPAQAQRHGHHVFNEGAQRHGWNRGYHYRGHYGGYRGHYRNYRNYYHHRSYRRCWTEWHHHRRVTVCRRW